MINKTYKRETNSRKDGVPDYMKRECPDAVEIGWGHYWTDDFTHVHMGFPIRSEWHNQLAVAVNVGIDSCLQVVEFNSDTVGDRVNVAITRETVGVLIRRLLNPDNRNPPEDTDLLYNLFLMYGIEATIDHGGIITWECKHRGVYGECDASEFASVVAEWPLEILG